MMDSASYRVIEAVAEKEGVSPTDLTPPLFDVIDPEALDALVRKDTIPNTSEVTVEFTYNGHRVTATSTGEVTVGRDRSVLTDGGVRDEDAFQLTLVELIREAADNDVDGEGGWLGPDEPDGAEYAIEICDVVRR